MKFGKSTQIMPLVLLIRHGENDFVKTNKLAGRLPGVHLNARGQKQAEGLGEALKDVPIRAVYSSPLERAMETAAPIASPRGLQIIPEPNLMDTDVGKWQGRSWKVLRQMKAWKLCRARPRVFDSPKANPFPKRNCGS
jgi:broad specificity phosphatase PhoE